MTEIRVLGIPGSLRQASYNLWLLKAAQELAPEGLALEIGSLAAIPLYDADVEAESLPEPVQELRARMAAADAVLIATPEYSSSIPGVLKNALDWASRPPDPPLNGKPGAILGATPGIAGTARAQLHLRQVCVAHNLLLLNRPDVQVRTAKEKFSADGTLTDEPTRQAVRNLLTALRDWTLRLRR